MFCSPFILAYLRGFNGCKFTLQSSTICFDSSSLQSLTSNGRTGLPTNLRGRCSYGAMFSFLSLSPLRGWLSL